MTDKIGKVNCFKLWRVWNFIFLLALYVYLVYDSIYLYIQFKKYSLDLAFGSNYSEIHMNLYLVCIILGLTCLPFTLYCLLFFNGNYADDNVRLGKDTDNFKIHQENDNWQSNTESKVQDGDKILLKRLKRHFLPYSFLMHYLSATFFLVPLPFLEAHQIRQRVRKQNEIWHSDLDFLFHPDNWHKAFATNERWELIWLLRPQYFNYIFCLICLILKYPAVFWACHKGFSFTFSFLITLASLHVIMDYSATSVLIRVAYNPDFVSNDLQITFLSPVSLMLLSILGSSVILLTFWCVFEFGFQQFLENLSRYRHLVVMQCDVSHDGSNLSDLTCCKRKHLYLRGYLPHFSAICGCAIGFGMKIPLFYASISIIYQQTSDPLILVNFLVAIFFICIWLITWFGFTLKQEWRFYLPSGSKAISDISSTTINNSLTTMMQQQKLHSRDHNRSDQINEVYSCHHSLNPHLVIDGRLRNDDCYSEENDLANNQASTNYVYLQSAMNPALNQIFMTNNIPLQNPGESPLMVSFNDNIDSRNTVSESESSYDSASNIRNQIIVSLDPRFQSLNARGIGGVLKYSDSAPRSYLPEYIPLKTEGIIGVTSKFDNCSSGETSTLLAGESDTTLKSITDSQQPVNQSVSLKRQNSNKKRIYGQRVTFKDEQLTDTVDCSPNNSEQSSNNTSSSDSGIDSNSKQPRNLMTQINLSDLNNASLLKRSGVNTYEASAKFIPPVNHSATSMATTFYGFGSSAETINSNAAVLNSSSQTIKNELASGTDRHVLSYLSESDQEPRLCSQV